MKTFSAQVKIKYNKMARLRLYFYLLGRDFPVNHTLRIRYILFMLLFILVAIGLALHSYTLLVVLAAVGIILALVGDRIENRPTDQFKQYNELHHRPKH